MAGDCTFQLTGKVTWVQDNPPQSGRPYGSVRMRLEIPTQCVGMATFPAHSLFVGVKYNQSDLEKDYGGCTAMIDSLQPGAHVFMRGKLNPKPASADGKWPAGFYIDASWRHVKVQEIPFPSRNKVYFDGEVIGINDGVLMAKYSYMNPRETDPAKKWKEREYNLRLSPDCHADVRARDNVFVEGRLLGKDPQGGDLVWVLADEVF